MAKKSRRRRIHWRCIFYTNKRYSRLVCHCCFVASAFGEKKCAECKIIAYRSIWTLNTLMWTRTRRMTEEWFDALIFFIALFGVGEHSICFVTRFICRLPPLPPLSSSSSSSCINCAIMLHILWWCCWCVGTVARCGIRDRSVRLWSPTFSQPNKRRRKYITESSDQINHLNVKFNFHWLYVGSYGVIQWFS